MFGTDFTIVRVNVLCFFFCQIFLNGSRNTLHFSDSKIHNVFRLREKVSSFHARSRPLSFFPNVCSISRLSSGGHLRVFSKVRGGNFTADSTFSSNLYRLVSSLSSLTSKPYGFYNLSSGDDSSGERAFATGLCRREVKRHDCLRCLQTAAQNLTEQCPQSKQAVVW